MQHQRLLDDYVTYIGLSRSPATQRLAREQLIQLFRAWEDLAPADWTRTRFERYYGAKRTAGLSPRSLGILLTQCRGFIAWAGDRAEDLGFEVPDFCKGLRSPKVHRERPVIYTPEEIEKLLNACHTSQRPMELVVGLAFYVGMRRREIQLADWSHVDWQNNQIQIIGSKVAKTRVLPIGAKLRNVLRAHWRNQKTGPIVQYASFNSNVSRCLRFVCQRAEVPYRSLHKIRHSFCTTLLERGVDVVTARDCMGHLDISTTNLYSQSTPNRMKLAVDVL